MQVTTLDPWHCPFLSKCHPSILHGEAHSISFFQSVVYVCLRSRLRLLSPAFFTLSVIWPRAYIPHQLLQTTSPEVLVLKGRSLITAVLGHAFNFRTTTFYKQPITILSLMAQLPCPVSSGDVTQALPVLYLPTCLLGLLRRISECAALLTTVCQDGCAGVEGSCSFPWVLSVCHNLVLCV